MKKLLFILSLVTYLSSLNCEAQYSVIVNFNGANSPQGQYPYGDVTRVRNLLYGMTYSGGANGFGCIFSVDTNGNNYKDLWDFNRDSGSNGANPYGLLTLSGSKLYGMTQYGGINDNGNIFSIDTNGSGYKDLWNFQQAHDSNGANPSGNLILSGGKLYGMTSGGGINNYGIIFRIDTNGGGYKNLWNFNQASDSNGGYPEGDLTLSGGKLYGMTSGGGINNFGNIFSIDTNGSGYKDLWNFNFTADSNGAIPYGSLTLSGGKLYGMTSEGGINTYGNIFRIDTNGKGYKNLWNFETGGDTNGVFPRGSLILSGDKLYGMTFEGGIHDSGTIFSIDTNGSGYRDMFNFTTIDGVFPQGSLTLSGGVFYGMAEVGGANHDGVVFSFRDTAIKTSINNLTLTSASVKVYPNPSNGMFIFQGKSEVPIAIGIRAKSNVEVYNMLGQQVYSQFVISNAQFIIDLSSQSNGVYLYRVISDDGSLTGEGKLVIEK